jgi:hypothetical protein
MAESPPWEPKHDEPVSVRLMTDSTLLSIVEDRLGTIVCGQITVVVMPSHTVASKDSK